MSYKRCLCASVIPAIFAACICIFMGSCKHGSESGKLEDTGISELKVDGKALDLTKLPIQAEVSSTVQFVTLTVTTSNNKAKVSVFFKKAGETEKVLVNPNGNEYMLEPGEGSNSVLITVTSESGKNKTEYKAAIIKQKSEASDDAAISELKLNDKTLNSSSAEITENVNSDVKSVILTVKPSHAKAAVTVTLKKAGESEEKAVSKSSSGYNLELKSGENKAFVKVTSESGKKSNTVTINIQRAEPSNEKDTSIKELKLDSKSLDIMGKEIVKTVEKESVILTIKPHNPKASVKVTLKKEGQASAGEVAPAANGYTLHLNDGINIASLITTSADGSASDTLILKIIKQTPLPSPQPNEVRVILNIVSFVNGTNVEGSTVKVYKHGNSSLITEKTRTSNENGLASFNLDKDSYYDFLIEGMPSKRAESRLEKVFTGSTEKVIPVIQRPAHIGELTKAPVIESLNYAVLNNNTVVTKEAITDGKEFNEQDITANKGGLLIKFRCPSKVIRGRGSEGGFGVAVNIGSPAAEAAQIGEVLKVDKDTETATGWICSYFVLLSGEKFPTGMETLYITAYDEAGNRIERHIKLNFKGQTSTSSSNTLTGASIKEFLCIAERLPKPVYIFSNPSNPDYNEPSLFGLLPHSGFETSCKIEISFKVQKTFSTSVPIKGYKLFRRETGNQQWDMVSKRYYKTGYNGIISKPGMPDHNLHIVADTDSRLEEGKSYDYKIEVYGNTESDKIESDTATVKILPAFNVSLTKPAENEICESDKVEFSFKVSNPALLDSSKTEGFAFGLLVTEKTKNDFPAFISKMKYIFSKQGDEALEIAYNESKYYKLSEWKSKGIVQKNITADDLISYNKDTGIVTIKKAFLEIGEFNRAGKRSFANAMTPGYSYMWDIQDWGIDAEDWIDDIAPFFFKNDRNSISVSKANLQRSDNAINGRGSFAISY